MEQPLWSLVLPPTLPECLHSWLIYSGSFMLRLQQYGVHNAQIEVLCEGWDYAQEQEYLQLDISSQEKVFIRQVRIHSASLTFMYARSIFPANFLAKTQNEYTHLAKKSIGSLLFADKRLSRSGFLFSPFQEQDYFSACFFPYLKDPITWVRNSTFGLPCARMLLVELFTPAVERLQNE